MVFPAAEEDPLPLVNLKRVCPEWHAQLPSSCAGAFVNVYVGAITLREALNKSEAHLFEDKYKPIDISCAYELDLDIADYDTDEKGYPNNKDLEVVRDEEGYWYGPFNTFPYDDDNV